MDVLATAASPGGGRLMPELLIGLKTGLSDWKRAFVAMHDGSVLKAVLVPEL